MSQNIYQTPNSDLQLEKLTGEKVEYLLSVAKRQKHLLYTFLVYLIYSTSLTNVSVDIRPIAQLFALPVLLAVIVFNIRLSWILYGTAGRIIMILLGAIPIVNFLVILVANSRANRLLAKNRIKVGFMGAKIKEIEKMAATT